MPTAPRRTDDVLEGVFAAIARDVHYRWVLSIVSTATLQYTAAAVTDRGRRRASNEDAFGYSVEDGVYVVCDGMGGAAGGEVASTLAVEEILRLLAGFRETALREEAGRSDASHSGDVPSIVAEAVDAANTAIHSRAQRSLRLNGMGTTLVAVVVGEERLWVVNVGDSRCYQLRSRGLRACTEDHSLIEEQVRMGRMTRAEAARSPLRHIITRALGTQRQVTPDVFELKPEPGDMYLLCSDGLTRELADGEIERILRAEETLEERCAALVEAANRSGGQDNITCVLIGVSEAA